MTKFFFDTADATYIKKIWFGLGDHIDRTDVLGVTTNPNAMDKMGVHSLEDFEVTVYKLTRLISSIRQDSNGVVYVQIPNSHATLDEYVRWGNYITKLGDRQTKVVLKIPPYTRILKFFSQYNDTQTVYSARKAVPSHIGFTTHQLELNVTGVADATTALLCAGSDRNGPVVKYISIIPGRMEEVGINADDHLIWLKNRVKTPGTDIIAGSMRTIDGLKRSIQYGCIPTIGTRVWDQFTTDDYKTFSSWWPSEDAEPEHLFEFGVRNSINIPITDDRNIELSKQFFEQMDKLGSEMYNEFIAK